jgi:hypothetical protein
VFCSDLLYLFPSSSLKTAADSFKMFVCVHHATWDHIPKSSVNILLMLTLVQSLSIYLILMVQNIHVHFSHVMLFLQYVLQYFHLSYFDNYSVNHSYWCCLGHVLSVTCYINLVAEWI